MERISKDSTSGILTLLDSLALYLLSLYICSAKRIYHSPVDRKGYQQVGQCLRPRGDRRSIKS